MLDFVNKRTAKDVLYKPTVWTMIKMFFGFIAVASVGAFIYIKLKKFWNHWVFWLVGSLVHLFSFRSFTLLAAQV
jgi:fatty-acid desaturase